jgi:hypothetical protein
VAVVIRFADADHGDAAPQRAFALRPRHQTLTA